MKLPVPTLSIPDPIDEGDEFEMLLPAILEEIMELEGLLGMMLTTGGSWENCP